MALVPRYVGTTAAAAATYVRDTIGSDAFTQYFDLDGDGLLPSGSEDERVFVRAVCSAETEVDEALGASSGAPFTGTIPDSIPEIVCMRILWCATRFRLFADPEKASARLLHKDSDVRLTRIAKDAGLRLLSGASTVVPQPAAGVAAAEIIAPDLIFSDPCGGLGGFG